MSESAEWTDDGEAWVVDTGVFVACGREGSQKFEALRRFAVSRELVFVIPQRVYEELGGAPGGSSPEQTPVDSAIGGGWVRVAADLDYTDGTVASVMDTVQSYIASSSNRPEDEIEKADAALAGVAVQLLGRVDVSSVRVVTTDRDAGEGAVTALEAHGFDGQIAYEDGFELVERLS